MRLAASCSCTSTILLRAGQVVCAACNAPIVAASSVNDGDSYSTIPGQWPPGCRSRRTARERIRAVRGHTCVGTGRASVWSVAAAAYRAHFARRPLAKIVPLPSSDEAAVEAALVAAGMRSTRGKAA